MNIVPSGRSAPVTDFVNVNCPVSKVLVSVTATGVSPSTIVTGWGGSISTMAAPLSTVSVTVHVEPTGKGPTTSVSASGVVNWTSSGSNPATGFPAKVQSTSASNTVPSGSRPAPGPSTTFVSARFPTGNVLVTVTSTETGSSPVRVTVCPGV